MTRLKKAGSWADLGPGMWFRDTDGAVVVRCGHAAHSDNRERVAHIAGRGDGKDRRIYPDGAVMPSIYFTDPICGWHEIVVLDGWVP